VPTLRPPNPSLEEFPYCTLHRRVQSMIEDLFSSSAMVSFSNKADENLLPSVPSKWLSERKMEQRGTKCSRYEWYNFYSADKPTFKKEDIPLLSISSLHLQLKTTAVELDNPLEIARAIARIWPSSPRVAKGVVQLTKWERVIKHPSGTLQYDCSMSTFLESWCCSLFNDASKGSDQKNKWYFGRF